MTSDVPSVAWTKSRHLCGFLRLLPQESARTPPVAGAVRAVMWRRPSSGMELGTSSSAAYRKVLDMPNKPNAAVGRLAIMDAALNGLLRELLAEIPGAKTGELTTGQAANELLHCAKTDPLLLTSDVTDWLKRVGKAAERRNQIMHAAAQDQCVICGDATEFAHKGNPVDRSEKAVNEVVAEFKDRIDEGVGHARDISHTLNERAKAAAVATAVATGESQAPEQILIGQAINRCAKCSPGGKPIHAVQLPTAAAVTVPSP